MTGNRTAFVFVSVIVSPIVFFFSVSLEHKQLLFYAFKLYITCRSKHKQKEA
jgi:hypothetical protein